MKKAVLNKKHIISLVIIFVLIMTVSENCLAEGVLKSTQETPSQQDLLKSFEEANQYTNNLFTPRAQKVITKSGKVETKNETQTHGSTPPIKDLRLKIQAYIEKKQGKTPLQEEQVTTAPKNQVILNCENMEYFAERTELEATGAVDVYFPESDSSLKADKLVYNQTTNFIKAYGHVVLINAGKEMKGDFLQVDMNEENAFMDNPDSAFFTMEIHSKKGYMYGDKIIQEQGKILAVKHKMLNIRAEMFGPDVDNLFVEEKDKSHVFKGSAGSKFKIKTNDLIITSKKEHDTATLKKAEIYFNGKKLGTIPQITIHTNKNQDYMEADYPEIGTISNLGMYAGPGFVFDLPHGTNLKLLPILNYQSDSENTDNEKFGWGGIAKFKSATNKTDMGYGTANNVFIMRGKQRLDDNLYLQYASNAYQDDWFLGFRMPRLMGELVYQDSYKYEDFLAKDMPMTYTHRIAAGYIQDGTPGSSVKLGEDGIGTMRFKYMNEVAQTLYQYKDFLTSPINARFEMVGEGSVGVYGTGDTQIIARIGPRIHSQYKNWMQDAGYFLSAYDDKTPLLFDRYMYGRSNVYMRETYRLCKYLTISWLGSLNLSGDSWNNEMLQENTFFFGIGPDDVRLNIGYDTIRQQSFVTMSMHLDTKGSSIEYNKLVIKNPDTLGKSNKKENNFNSSKSNTQNVNNKSTQNDEDENEANQEERAEVINIQQEVDSL